MRKRLTQILLAAAALAASTAGPGAAQGQAPKPHQEPEDVRAERAAPWLGVLLGDAVDGGVRIVAVIPNSPAERAGLRTGDLMLVLHGLQVTDRDAVGRVLDVVKPGDPVKIRVLRDRQLVEKTVRTGQRWVRTWTVSPGHRIGIEAPEAVLPHLLAPSGPGSLLGVQLVSISPELRLHYGAPRDAGLLVSGLKLGGSASQAGLKVGDVLVRACGRGIRRAEELNPCLLQQAQVEVQLEIVRDYQPQVLKLTPPQRYADLNARDAVAASRAALAQRLVEAERANQLRIRLIEEEIARLKKRLGELQQELKRLK